jgi:DsbC/DsbD-like thiol-disulfide interchange protein
MIAQRKAAKGRIFVKPAKMSKFCNRIGLFAALLTLGSLGAIAAPDRLPSVARLIDGGVYDGARYAALEIRLPGEAVTYWRNPGDAGSAPQFAFGLSENIATAEPLYPSPERIDEDGAKVFGYRHKVVFPIRIALREKDKPAVLALGVDYAVCDKLCLPVHADLRIAIPAQANASEAQLTEALAQIPRPLDAAGALGLAAVARTAPADGKPQWLLRFASSAPRDVFVEAPPGFTIDAARIGDAGASGVFLLTLAENPKQKPAPAGPVRVTVSGPSPVEFDLALPQPQL